MSGPVSPLVTQQSCLGFSSGFTGKVGLTCQETSLRIALPSSLALAQPTHCTDKESKAPKRNTDHVMKQGLIETATCVILS